MHEPWPLHENFRPDVFDKEFTDRDPLPDELPDPTEPEVFEDAASEDAESPIGGVDTVDEEVGGDPTTPDEEIPDTGPPLPTPEEQRAKLDEEIEALQARREVLAKEYNGNRQIARIGIAKIEEANTLRSNLPITNSAEFDRLTSEINALIREGEELGNVARPLLAEIEALDVKVLDLRARRDAIK
jgi:hypothetical protein